MTMEEMGKTVDEIKALSDKLEASYTKLFGRPRERSEWVEPQDSDHEIAENMRNYWANQQAGSE